jgi:hypothetical protein
VSAERTHSAAQTPPTAAPPATDNLVGLAMSGGGIRSATFGLGALQALHRLGLLGIFDYVSTVSGGGFTGAWWCAWLSRAERRPPDLFPEAEDIEPSRRPSTLLAARDSSKPPDETRTARDPIHHLRLFAHYLTPRRGALSADTWRAVTFYVRSLVFNWLVLIPMLLVMVMAAQLYFVAWDRDVALGFTVDQWFDEAQFESYRKLAYDSVASALRPCVQSGPLGAAHVQAFFSSLEAQHF